MGRFTGLFSTGPDVPAAVRSLVAGKPLAAVDVPLRKRILPYLRRVRDDLKLPIVYVSHDREEVEALADVVVRLEDGKVDGLDRV